MDNKTKQQKNGKTKGENNPVGQLVEQQIAQSQSVENRKRLTRPKINFQNLIFWSNLP